MFFLPFVILLASSPAWAWPGGATQTQALTAYQARSIIVPFYKALNTGNDAIALINQATSSDWTSCGGNDACKRRDQVGPAIAVLQKAVPDLK